MKNTALYNRTLLEVSKWFLAFLILSINLNGANFFHTKEIAFFLFLAVSLSFGTYKNIWPLFIMLAAYFFSLIANLTNPYMDITQGLRYILGLLYLILMSFSNRKYQHVIVKTYVFSALIVGIMTIVIWGICNTFPVIKNALILYFGSIDTGEAAFLFMIRNRKILHWWIMGVYYSTAPCMIPALAYSLYQVYKENSRKYLIASWILTVALVLTMARANILAALAVNFLYVCTRLLKEKKVTLFFLILCASICFALGLAFLFLNDKGESSLSVKTLHKISYSKEFDSNMIKFFLTGWGAGSKFYSSGYREWTYLTELSLYETIRRYGLVSTIIIFLCIWLSPIIQFDAQKKPLGDILFWTGVFFSYLFVACTNPFLLGSIGFCALFFMTTVLKYQIA